MIQDYGCHENSKVRRYWGCFSLKCQTSLKEQQNVEKENLRVVYGSPLHSRQIIMDSY